MSLQKPKIRVPNTPVIPLSRQPARGTATPVADFTIYYHQTLNHLGELVQDLSKFSQQSENLVGLYRSMMLTRLFDKKAIALQRTGQLGTYASSLGQEAIGVAIGASMLPEDVLLPSYREYGAQFMRGVTMTEILLYWGGDERGMDYQVPGEDFPICVPVASQCTHAVGVAYAFKYRKQPRVAVCVLGDGGTSKGDFYEAMNVAGAWQLPVVFVINNNQWAISVSREKQSAAKTLAQKAIAAGFEGEQVDGNDVIGLQDRLQRAMDKARKQQQPMLVEALTYRMCDHTTADNASRYRADEEVDTHQIYDPMRRLKHYLLGINAWSEEKDIELAQDCTAAVDESVKAYLEIPVQSPESMFDYLYAQLPDALVEQRDHVSRRKPHV